MQAKENMLKKIIRDLLPRPLRSSGIDNNKNTNAASKWVMALKGSENPGIGIMEESIGK